MKRNPLLNCLLFASMPLFSCSATSVAHIDYFIEFESSDVALGSVAFVETADKLPVYSEKGDCCRMIVWEGEDAKAVYAAPNEGCRFLGWSKRVVILSGTGWGEREETFAEQDAPLIKITSIYENAIYTASFERINE